MKTLTNCIDIVQALSAHLVSIGYTMEPETPTSRITQDSRQVRRFDVFVALKGHDLNGADYIDAAISNGAGAVLIDSACFQSQSDQIQQLESQFDSVLFITVPELRGHLADLCQQFYFAGGQPLPVIGITGTNGKTSISHLLAQVADRSVDTHGHQTACAVIGTMGTGHYRSLVPSANTTPGITDVYRLMAEFRQDQLHQYAGVAMEVSSHALAQGRVDGVHFDIAVFTNLSHEHLDYHGSMAAYFAEKAKLFLDYKPNNAVVNIDDEYGLKLVDLLPMDQRVVVVGETKQTMAFTEYVWIKHIECHSFGLQVELEWQIGGSKELTTLNLPLYGAFNAANIAAVFATATLAGWSFDRQIFSELEPVPGRLELFVAPEQPIAIVDYAHTPDALEASLLAAKAHLNGELFLIFGCGGDRDTSKRPLMAAIAEQYASKVIMTNDNPRTENEQTIIRDIRAGFTNPDQHMIELDRKVAITYALQQAKPGDAVMVAGKGHEAYQIIGKQVFEYDERAYVAAQLAEMSGQPHAKAQTQSQEGKL